MKVFYGAAIQGARDRRERAEINRALIDAIKSAGHDVVTEHTAAKTYDEAMLMLQDAFGRLPEDKEERTIFNRTKIIEALESRELGAAVFDVTVPSLGTGIEIEHACARKKMGLPEIPVLLLYDPSYGRELSGMIRGMAKAELPKVATRSYDSVDKAASEIASFLSAVIS